MLVIASCDFDAQQIFEWNLSESLYDKIGWGHMPLNKITLKSTSRISLNDRFTSLRGMDDATDGIEERRQVVQASRKNLRLAQQMEHRPAVIAALGSVQHRGGVRGRGRGVMRGRGQLRGRGVLQGSRSLMQGSRGLLQGARGAVRGSLPGARGAGRTIRGGSIRGINFRTGAPLTSRVGGIRDVNSAAVPVKKRLAVQGRLSQPLSASLRGRGAWATRGSFKVVQSNFIRGAAVRGGVRGRGSFRGRGMGRGRGRGADVSTARGSFQTRTFRGRARGGRGRGGYSQQWGNRI
ncbi:hypothetical protein FHG87_002950 [Trinorchestia longiramus]|nr:hypothetical protein FHG87_002950 [Trinorchestia longiramus]